MGRKDRQPRLNALVSVQPPTREGFDRSWLEKRGLWKDHRIISLYFGADQRELQAGDRWTLVGAG